MNTAVDPSLFNAIDFDKQLAHTKTPLELFRTSLKASNKVLKERFLSGCKATELVEDRTHIIDAILIRAWILHFTVNDNDIALLAVGGYGRGELHPQSDIDVQILLQRKRHIHKQTIEKFLTFLWDIGLEIGHSVRTLRDCVQQAKKDITIATNLQEGRLLIGPPKLFEKQQKLCGPKKIWPSRAYFTAKWNEQTLRHKKFNDTAYNLEPNIKESPGGLRDIQMIGWIAKRHFGAETLHDLVEQGFLSEGEYQSLEENQAFLWKIRIGLHVLTDRREDRLLIDHQRTLAKQFGYEDDDHRLAVEKFMKKYYRTVMDLSRLNDMLLQLFQEEILYAKKSGKPVPINNRFQMRKGFIEVAHEKIFKQYPFALLEVFLLLGQHPELKGVRANTIRLIREHQYLINEDFRNDLRCRSLFMEILRQKTWVTRLFRRMNGYGVLTAYLPKFGRIAGQMQHDLFHVYTVDAHTLFVIRNLRRFTVEKYNHEFPLCSQVMKNLAKQEIVLISALFHDIAKGRGGDHSELGAEEAITFCKQHGLSDYDTRLVSWLVQNHLIMSLTAQRKDISDPEVVYDFAHQIGDQPHLDYLYLLTVADIRATSPQVWNSWKDALLKELYLATSHVYHRGLDNPELESEKIQNLQMKVKTKLSQEKFDPGAIKNLWDNLDDEYFLHHNESEVSWHTSSILKHPNNKAPIIQIQKDGTRGGTEILIYSKEHTGLFTLITSILDQSGLTVVSGRVFSLRDSYILDTFVVLESTGEPIQSSYRLQEIQNKLEHYLTKPDAEIIKVTRHLPSQIRHFKFPSTVVFTEDKHNKRTIMEVCANDQPGMLSMISSVMDSCGVRLQTALIATYGERAEDIFYITDKDCSMLRDKNKLECLQKTITSILDVG